MATNPANLIGLGFVLSLLGMDNRSTSATLVIAALFDMGVSCITLAMSKWSANSSPDAKVIEQSRNPHEVWVLSAE